jgi:hypothetical protein
VEAQADLSGQRRDGVDRRSGFGSVEQAPE